jgi:hypothetical protein
MCEKYFFDNYLNFPPSKRFSNLLPSQNVKLFEMEMFNAIISCQYVATKKEIFKQFKMTVKKGSVAEANPSIIAMHSISHVTYSDFTFSLSL